MKEDQDEKTEDKYSPGQLKLGLPAFEKYPRVKRHWKASTPVVDDITFPVGSPEEEKEAELAADGWPYGPLE